MSSTPTRRTVLGVGAAVLIGPIAANSARAHDYPQPYSGFAPADTVLRPSAPQGQGLAATTIERAITEVTEFQHPVDGARPLYPGHVAMMVHDGGVVATSVAGYAVRYASDTSELPPDQWVPMVADTIFDLASISKLFTSIAAMQLVEEGAVALEAPVARYLPGFEAQGKAAVTVKQLLTHTSGFVPFIPLWRDYPNKDARIAAVLRQPLEDPPGSVYRYSDLNLIALGWLVERVRGDSLDHVVRDRITAPLDLTDTGFNPAERDRCAATEFQTTPNRGMVRGVVHDENAWSLGGVAGHAGVFSTARDLAILGQAMLNGGSYGGARILAQDSVTAMITNFTTDFPGDDHGLGFELNQAWYMDALTGPRTTGHTGYTGTSLVIDFDSRSIAILLTNRVHPTRLGPSVNPARRSWARGLGLAMPVRTRRPAAVMWESPRADNQVSTLEVPVHAGRRGAKLGFDVIAETEDTDVLLVESSADGTSWMPVALSSRTAGETRGGDGTISGSPGRRPWQQLRGEIPADTARVRWRFSTDANSRGRGVILSRITIRGAGVGVDSDRHTERFIASGWIRTDAHAAT